MGIIIFLGYMCSEGGISAVSIAWMEAPASNRLQSILPPYPSLKFGERLLLAGFPQPFI